MSYILNPASGLYLEDSPTNGVILNSRRQGSKYQEWSLESQREGTFVIKNMGSGKVLDVEGGGVPRPTTKVITYPEHANSNQRWYMEKDDTIATASNRNLVLDVEYGDFREGAKIIVYNKHGANNQIFKSVPN